MKVDWPRFVAGDREELSRPLLGPDGWVYASDGRIAVRVPLADLEREDGEWELFPGIHLAMGKLDWACFEDPGWFFPAVLPPAEWLKVQCSECGGTGRCRKCPECKGTGDVECPCCHQRMDCDACGLTGLRGGLSEGNPCYDCGGSGVVKTPLGLRAEEWPAGLIVGSRYVETLAALPGLRLDLARWKGEKFPLAFVFGDEEGWRLASRPCGQGFVMPWRNR